jgi:hypothetical protein
MQQKKNIEKISIPGGQVDISDPVLLKVSIPKPESPTDLVNVIVLPKKDVAGYFIDQVPNKLEAVESLSLSAVVHTLRSRVSAILTI